MESEVKSDESSRWYVLNHIGNHSYQSIAQKTVDRFNESEQTSLKLFAPTYFKREVKGGKEVARRVSLAFHYVFVFGKIDDITRLCGRSNGFSFLLNRAGAERYATISDIEMNHFMMIARKYQNSMPFFSVEDVDLENGDIVEVVNGDFPGMRGTFIPKHKSNKGKIVLNIALGCATAAYDIKVSDVRVIEFAKNTTRAHDQIESFIDLMLPALRFFQAGKDIELATIAKINVFCRRMAVVKLNSSKVDAKLQALLSVGNYILGNEAEAARHRAMYEKYRPAVTNPWTAALINLLLGITYHDHSLITTGHSLITSLTPASKAQHTIAEEYERYVL